MINSIAPRLGLCPILTFQKLGMTHVLLVRSHLPRHHKIHQHQKGNYTCRDDDDCFGGDSLLGMHRSRPGTFGVVYTVHTRFAGRFMWFHTSDVLFTKNGYSLGFDGIAPFDGTIPNSDEIRERIGGVRGAGDTGQTGIGKGTTKIFCIRAIGQFNRNFTLNAIPRTQLRNWTHLEKMLKIIPAIGQGNVGAVFAPQIPISIGECKPDFDGIQRNTSTAALVN